MVGARGNGFPFGDLFFHGGKLFPEKDQRVFIQQQVDGRVFGIRKFDKSLR